MHESDETWPARTNKSGSLTGDGDGLQKEPGSLSSSYFPFIDNYPTSSVSRPKQRDFL